MGINPSGWKQPSFWRLNSAVLLILPLFFVRAELHFETGPAAALTLFHLVMCLILTAALHLCYRRILNARGMRVPIAAWIIMLSLVATTIQTTLTHFFLTYMVWHTPGSSLEKEMLLRMLFFFFVYAAWSMLYFWLRAERSAAEEKQHVVEARAAAQQLELQFLRSQLDPHFLFNALNGVATVIPSDPANAAGMVREMAGYLRYTLEHREDSVAHLSMELRAVDAYLKMERLRFGESLRVRVTVSPQAERRTVPCFLLQPLVENAIKHSFSSSLPPWDLAIDAECGDDILRIVIRNTGILSPGGGKHSTGVGLDTLRRRLALLYPGRHRFELRQENDSVLAELELRGEPCQE